MLCARCGNTTKGKHFCTRCGATLPQPEELKQNATSREIASAPGAATLFVLPSAPIVAPMSARIFAPTTRKLAGLETAEQVSARATVAVATTALARPRQQTATRLFLLCASLLAVSGFWWGRTPAVLAQLQSFVTTSELNAPPPPALTPPAALSNSALASPALSPVEAPPTNPVEASPALLSSLTKDAEPQPRFKSQPQPRLRTASRPTFRPQAQPKPQLRPSFATKLQSQTRPGAILVLEMKGDIGKKGKKIKELCDKD